MVARGKVKSKISRLACSLEKRSDRARRIDLTKPQQALKSPYLFDEFFASGQEESISPFLTPGSRKWGRNLSLKSASSAACFLALAFGFSFVSPPLSYFFLALVYFLS